MKKKVAMEFDLIQEKNKKDVIKNVLSDILDEAIEDIENGRVYSEKEVFAELDAI